MVGHVHSIETFGTVDGPGVRLVVFLQGCPMRCQYCHNPDTWKLNGGTDMTVSEIMAVYEKNRAFYSRGGITVTGGEALLQIDFVTELFSAAAQRGIHTCLDTSGITFNPKSPKNTERFDKLMSVTDLVLLDIKHIDPQGHRDLTGQSLEPVLAFAHYLDVKAIPVWIRHVAVPGITYEQTQLYQLGRFLGTLHNIKAIEVLPYHDMGKAKYKNLEIPYPLEETRPLTSEEAAAAKQVILKGYRDVKKA